MNYRKLSDKDLAAFAENIVTLLSGTELDAIDVDVRSALIAAFGALPATLAARSDAAEIAKDVVKAAFADKRDTAGKVYVFVGQVRNALNAGLAPRAQYNLCGLDRASKSRTAHVAQDPTELSATGASNGVNRLTFSGNNRSGRVVYEIYRRERSDGRWDYLNSTGKQRYTDTTVTPGQYYEYKVRAVAAKTVSNYSNPAVVYGAL